MSENLTASRLRELRYARERVAQLSRALREIRETWSNTTLLPEEAGQEMARIAEMALQTGADHPMPARVQ